MTLGDFSVYDPRGHVPVANPYQTKAGNTAINAGEWVIQGTGGDVEYVTVAANGAADSAVWVGVAATTDTVTAGADGVVYVYDDPNYLFVGGATTPANLATTVINTQVTLDVTTNVQTVDENDTTNGTLIIRDYNSGRGTVVVQMAATDHLSQG